MKKNIIKTLSLLAVVAMMASCNNKPSKMDDAAEEEQQEDPDLEKISPDELHRLISELPIGYRMVVNLYVFEDYSHRQIAELLSISERTSASQFYYAKRLLARKIKELTKDKR